MQRDDYLLPADTYVIHNKTIITDKDYQYLLSFYMPLIGPIATSLYLCFLKDLDKREIASADFNHHHLMTILKLDLASIKKARITLESFGLLKTFLRKGSINNYIYELFSPLSPNEFFNHPIFNVLLFNNIGKNEYDLIRSMYITPKTDYKEYENITTSIDENFESSIEIAEIEMIDKTTAPVTFKNSLDFDLILSSIPKGVINERIFNSKMKDLLNSLAFIYDLDSLKISELIRSVVTDNGSIDKNELRKAARNFYQQKNGTLPTVIYRKQPEYLKTIMSDDSSRSKMLFVFDNTSPYDFLKDKYGGISPTARDKKLLEELIIDLELKPAVVNVLIDYVLKINNNKLNSAYVETIAGQWKRIGCETAKEAMEIAEKEHKKINKKFDKNISNEKLPVWFNEKQEKEQASEEEIAEMEKLLEGLR